MMQRGSLAMVSRKEAPGVWQFRWSEKDLHGVRVQRKRVIGSVERYPNETAARSAVTVLLAEINSDKVRMGSRDHQGAALRSLRATRTGMGRYVAQLRNQVNVSSVPDPLDSPALTTLRTG